MPGLWVRHSPASAAVVRESVRSTLEKRGVGEDEAYEATLIVSELVGNAIRHAPCLPSGYLAVQWAVSDRECTISVTDGGTDSDVSPIRARTADVSGRGLAIVTSLTDRWGVNQTEVSTTVWAVYRFSPPREFAVAGS